jgi:hypothetical protein
LSCEGENDTDIKNATFVKVTGTAAATTKNFKPSEVQKYSRIKL